MIKKTLSMLMILTSLAYANNTKDAKSEIGWRFGNFDDVNSTKEAPKTQKEILKKILSVQEEQLKVQKDILDVLQKRFDPQPETIIVNGKPCIANSSAECYKWIPEPEAKRNPVIAEFFSNPSKEKAAKYLQWYSKHTNNAKKAGVAMVMAKYQYGDNATDFNSKKNGMLGSFGEISQAKTSADINTFKKYNDMFYMNLYLGRGLDVDLFGTRGIRNALEKFPKLTLNIIYYNQDVKNKLHAISKEYPNLKFILNSRKEYVDKDLFTKNGIYSTPTIELVLKKDKSRQIIVTGNFGTTSMVKNAIEFLWLKKVIKENNYASDYKVWDHSKFVENTSYSETGKVLDLKKYQYRNTDMKPLEVPKELTK